MSVHNFEHSGARPVGFVAYMGKLISEGVFTSGQVKHMVEK